VNNKIDAVSFFNRATKYGYLSPANLEKYAPKIKKLLENMKTAKGPSLIYSQYRTFEGLGALTKVLENDGYSEVTVKKMNGELHLVTDRSAHAKHFIVFSNTNAEKIQVLMDVFNKNYSNLPASINADLESIKNKNIDVICITQAGSEGISLKGVRQVHILEPYWNYIRMMQVIGRAVRAKSHLHLDKKDQNVDVFLYMMVYNAKQIKIMEWDAGRLSDSELTSDEIIYWIAKRKENTLQHLLTIMKETAMDCKVHLNVHKKTETDIKCIY
jgi:superfamily II DNA or RNA helicase